MSAENDPLGPLPPGWGEFPLFLPNTSNILTCCQNE